MPDVIINMDDMTAIFVVTDVMGIHRESVSVELTKEDPGSINRTGAGVIELTIPESRSAEEFASELRTALEGMGYVPTEIGEDEEDEI
jgi:DNA-binding NarL/FixJ family response regulator